MTDDTTEPGPETTPVIGANDGALPPETTAPVTHSVYDAALAAGNVPDQAAPSGGDMDAGDVGNGASLGLGGMASPESLNQPATEGTVTHGDAGLVRVSGITVIDQEDPEQAYETARQAAVDAGDTSWPTWGFLPLEQKMQYIGL